jgi:hypothetical protein
VTYSVEVQRAIDQLRGLRALEETGMNVHRSRHKLLNKLSDEALPIVAAWLESEGKR